MVSSTFAAFAAMSVAFTAIDLFPYLELPPRSPSTSASPTTTAAADGAVQVFLLSLAAATAAALFTAVASVYLHHAAALAAAVGAAGDKSLRRLAEPVTFVLCGAAGVLELLIFARPPDGALGRAAVDALPGAATVTFFLGVTLLIVVAHIRAGGEGGGGGGDDRRRVPAVYVDVLKKVALGAAAAVLVGLVVAAALYVK